MDRNQSTKSSFFDKLKSVFRSKPPSYKFYSPGQVKVIAMKSRIYLQQHYKKSMQAITASDSRLFQRKDFPNDCYQILQEIGKLVIEAESIKIYVEILRKIQNGSAAIVKTNGDIALLKTQLNWFQCVLWYRKCKKIQGLDSMHDFCYNFFKGVDITCQINPKCQIFRLYPIMLYLDPKCIIPLKKLYPQIIQYINTRIQQNLLIQIFKMNKDEIKKWFNKQQTEYKQRYISNSKSPMKQIFRNKQLSPKKVTQNSSTSKINLNQPDKNGNKSEIKQSKQKPNNQIKSQVSIKSQTSGGSFMRKVMESSSKNKENKPANSKIICIQCGNQYSKEERDKNEELHQQQSNPSQNQNICKQCQMSRQKLMQQLHNSKIKQKEKKVQKKLICKQCGNQMKRQQRQNNEQAYQGENNPYKLNCQNCLRNKQQTKIKQQIISFKCIQCGLSVEIQRKQQPIQQNTNRNQNMCLSCYHKKNYYTCTECQIQCKKQQREGREKDHQNYQELDNPYANLCRKCYESRVMLQRKEALQKDRKLCKNCNKQMIKNNTSQDTNQVCYQCEKYQNSNKTEVVQQFEDQQQSLRFIRQSLVQKKKPIKKPYMVSIYARAQYVNHPNK